MPKYLGSDHDPLFLFERWRANLRILGVAEIKTVPYVPRSHPFGERLIGTIQRKYLDRTLFWTSADLEDKPLEFRNYYNRLVAFAIQLPIRILLISRLGFLTTRPKEAGRRR